MSAVKKLYLIILDFVETLVLVGAIFLIIYIFLFRPYQVNGLSMDPNFHHGEYILTNIITLKLSPLNRGDVIVFQAPPNTEKDYIKRIIGMPSDRIMLQNGRIYVNNQLIDENAYLSPSVRTLGGQFLRDNQEITVPPGNYFVMGDNREFSSDSREWGYVSKDKIIGKSFVVYWPVEDFKVIKDVKYGLN